MPSAVPFQQGLIGLYNNSQNNPGVYVSWDADTNFNSTQSVIFKGMDNTGYRFPLIVNTYNNNGTQTLGEPLSLGSGTTYIYCLNENGLIAYQKNGDVFTTVGFASNLFLNAAFSPEIIKVGSIGTSEIIAVGFSTFFAAITFNGSSFVKSNGLYYENLCGISTSSYEQYDFCFNNNKIYFSYQGEVLAGNVSLDNQKNFVLGAGSTGVIINSSNGFANNTNNIDCYDGTKIAVSDTENNIYEFIYEGNVNAGNTTNEWVLNFSLEPTENQIWNALMYNHFGIIVACDSYNNTINVVTSANVTINTDTYGTLDGFSYQIVSTSSETSTQGKVVNSVGGIGYNYLQFNTPQCITEDPYYNIIIGDLNNRLTYMPTSLDFVAGVQAPLTEYIDPNGNPADIYYIKQATDDFSSIKSLPPMSGDELLIKSSVLYELNALLRVPVYDEEPLFGYNRTSAKIAYGDIVTDPAPEVRITCSTNGGQRSPMYTLSPYNGFYNSLDQSNSDPFDAPNLSNNYPNGLFYRFTNEGKFYFFDINGNPVSLQEYDTILVSYYVKMFTNNQINNALYLALQSINAQPGVNKISQVASAPFYYDAALVSGATFYLLRQLLVGLNQRERRLLVMDPEQGSYDAVASLRDTMKTYQEEFKDYLEKLPLAVRPVMGTISVPEYAFPGGRSRLFRSLWKGGAS